MIRLGLTGHPLEHSLSPVLHEAAFQAIGLQGKYSLYPVEPGDAAALGHLVDRVRAGELIGLNVTIPHKQGVLRFLDDLTPAARIVGAVNTIYLEGSKVLGDNTDAPGFLTDLRQLLRHSPRSSIVMGAGGAARAVVYALSNTGCKVTVAARRIEQGRELAALSPEVRAIELRPETLRNTRAELIVNTTPVGMFPKVDNCPWPAGIPFPENAAVYDLIYNPRETLLVSRARAAGLEATTGLGMLVEQAALAFERWTGCRVGRDLLMDAINQIAL